MDNTTAPVLQERLQNLVDEALIEDDVVEVSLSSHEWNIVRDILFEVHNYYVETLPEGNKRYDYFMDMLSSAYDKVNNVALDCEC